jgi:hypothetical protein
VRNIPGDLPKTGEKWEKYGELRARGRKVGERLLRAGIHQGDRLKVCREDMVELSCHKDGTTSLHSVSSCNDRLCPQCSRARGLRVGGRIQERAEKIEGTPYFLTLTFRNTHDLKDFEYYANCFKKLRRRRFWSKDLGAKLLGGAVAFETTLTDSGDYHAHLHCLIYLDRPLPVYPVGPRSGEVEKQYCEVIAEQWQAITGDSFIVDLRAFDGDTRELLKYACKGIETMPNTKRHDEMLRRFYDFSRGRRFIQTFGCLYGRVKEEMDDALPTALPCGCKNHEAMHYHVAENGARELVRVGHYGPVNGRMRFTWAKDPKLPDGVTLPGGTE